jgi:phosphotransferase system HPr-like phosphotransfer protein
MLERKIRLRSMEDVTALVSAAEKCAFRVEVKNDQMSIDGKSIVGLVNLDLTRPLLVCLDGRDEALEKVLDRFQAE